MPAVAPVTRAVGRHPYRAVGAVLTVMAACLFVAATIGQYNDGPWGGLPEWLAALTWFGFLLSIPVMLVLCAYLGVAHLRGRKEHRTPVPSRT
jgi:hypothetical protein